MELWLDRHKRPTTTGDRQFDLRLADRYDGGPDGIEAHATLTFSWFGDVGPYAGWRGSDGLIQALTGAAYSFGLPEGPPVIAQGHGPSIIASVTGLIPALAALTGRRDGDAPVRIDVNVFEAAMCITETAAIGFAGGGPASGRLGINRFFPTYPASAYEAADGWVGLTALTPQQWQGLCRLLGLTDAAADPRFTTADMRLQHADEIDGLLAPAFRSQPADAWAMQGQGMRIPMTAVRHPGELPDVEHWRVRGSFDPLTPDAPIKGPRAPFIIKQGNRQNGVRARKPTPLRPLAGFRILDFTMGWSGPLATRHLGDLGADVIKVESLDFPDWWRGWEARTESDRPSHEIRSSFNAVNRNKRDVTIDMRSEDGKAQVRRLARGADLTIENFTPGVLEGLGFSVAEMQSLSPGIVCISMGAFGAAGPLKGFRAYGSTVEQASGLPFVNGQPDWKPCIQHVAYGDAVAGLFAAFAAVSTLYGQADHGGASVDLSQVECLFQFAAPAILAEQVTGVHVARSGSHTEGSVWAQCVRCAGDDEWLFVDVPDANALRSLAAAIGQDMSSDGGQEIGPVVEAWARQRRAGEAADILQRAGVLAAPVQPAHLLSRDPHLLQSGYWTSAERRYVGKHLHGQAPYRLNGDRVAILKPSPLLGEHNDEVLAGDGADWPDVSVLSLASIPSRAS